MKKISTLAAALAFGLTASVVFAQPAPPPPGEGRPHPPRDCSKAPDAEKKAHCEAMQAAMKAAREKCKDKAEGDERRNCMKDAMPKKDK
jgi:hypothetical protein